MKIKKDFRINKKNQEFKLKINKYQFDGTLLPKLSSNFKLEQYFDFCLFLKLAQKGPLSHQEY